VGGVGTLTAQESFIIGPRAHRHAEKVLDDGTFDRLSTNGIATEADAWRWSMPATRSAIRATRTMR
jgi:hypothetical protein